MTTTDPFGPPGLAKLPDRGDPFGVPSDSGRATRMGDAEDRAEVPRDQWDRYLMPALDGTKPAANKGYTRVSTTKSALSNTFGIQDWAKRRVIEGLGQDETLVAEAIRASRMPDGKDKEKALRRVASAAFDIGGGKERSGLGTEFHELTEAHNRGELKDSTGVDEKWMPELDAYTEMLRENSIRILPQYLERQVLCPYNNAGTLDNIVEWWNPDTEEWELVVADLKTGRSLDLGWLEILMQLWLYANAYGLWTTTAIIRNDPKDPDKITDVEGFYEDMPRELRQDKALIFHCPLDGTASLYVLDISGVERYVKAAVEAKRANAEAKNKVTKVSTYRPEAFVAQPNDFPSAVTVAELDQPSVWSQAECPDRASHPAMSQCGSCDYVHHRSIPPTPDQQSQVDKAAERLAKVAATSDASVTTPPVTIERDPVTGRKKRTCGFCRQPGHVQKTCPSNPDSPKYHGPAATDARAEANVARVAEMAAPLLAEDDEPVAMLQKDSPFCLRLHPGSCQWTSSHPDAPAQWVCSVSGKPGKRAYETGQTAVTPEPPLYGAPDLQPVDLGAQAATWPAPLQQPDMVMWGIKTSVTQAEVLLVRSTAMGAGTWIDAVHDEPARARYIELTPS